MFQTLPLGTDDLDPSVRKQLFFRVPWCPIAIAIVVGSGWWFGTWLLFSIIYGMSSQLHWRTPSFFKMVIATTNQHMSWDKYIYYKDHSVLQRIDDLAVDSQFFWGMCTVQMKEARRGWERTRCAKSTQVEPLPLSRSKSPAWCKPMRRRKRKNPTLGWWLNALTFGVCLVPCYVFQKPFGVSMGFHS